MTIEELFVTHQEEIHYTMVRFSRKQELSEDAAQHAFLKAMLHRQMLENMPAKAAKAWLFSTARNYLIDELRKVERVFTTEEETTFDRELESFEHSLLLQQIIEELPSPRKEVVVLRYYSRLNATEIGTQLKMNASTVRYHLSQALATLKTKI